MDGIHEPDPNHGARGLLRKKHSSKSLGFRSHRSFDDNRLIRKSSRTFSNRVPGVGFLGHTMRNHFIACVGEFVGTFLFLFFAFSGTQVANTTNTGETETRSTTISRVLFISLCFGFSLAVNAWVFFRISGGLFNPAVTVGMCIVGALPAIRGSLLFISQILGGIAAAAVVSVLFPGPLVVTTTLQVDTSVVQGLFIEMFLTVQLVLTIFMLAAEKHKATFIAPVGIGLSLFIAELTGVFFTGGSLNPARSFGPAVVLHDFDNYHWIYWLGPILGSVVAAGFYFAMKKLEYETANPHQDHDREVPVVDLEKDLDEEKAMSLQDLPPVEGISGGQPLPDASRSRSRGQSVGRGQKQTHFCDTDTILGSSDGNLVGSRLSPLPPFAEFNYGYWVPVTRPDDANAPPGAVLYMRQMEDPSRPRANTNTSALSANEHAQDVGHTDGRVSGQSLSPRIYTQNQPPLPTNHASQSQQPTARELRPASRRDDHTDSDHTALGTAHDGTITVNDVTYEAGSVKPHAS